MGAGCCGAACPWMRVQRCRPRPRPGASATRSGGRPENPGELRLGRSSPRTSGLPTAGGPPGMRDPRLTQPTHRPFDRRRARRAGVEAFAGGISRQEPLAPVHALARLSACGAPSPTKFRPGTATPQVDAAIGSGGSGLLPRPTAPRQTRPSKVLESQTEPRLPWLRSHVGMGSWHRTLGLLSVQRLVRAPRTETSTPSEWAARRIARCRKTSSGLGWRRSGARGPPLRGW
jgi:hypothetical protein